MFGFEWPWFALILPVPFLVYYFGPAKKMSSNAQTPEIRFPHIRELQAAYGQNSNSIPSRKSYWHLLMHATWVFSVIALMRPQIIDQVTASKAEGRDIMLAVDLSTSMQSYDFVEDGKRVDRLEVAKKVVKDFILKRSGDRVGLVSFGAKAYLQSPLTSNLLAVTKMLDNNIAGMAGDATSIGDAIGIAVKNLRDLPAKSRALVLLTDGEDNASTLPPLEAAKLANQYKIRVYTVVIGTEGIVPFPDGNGGLVMTQSHINTALTQKIAEITDGEFYRATDANMLAKIYDQIDSLQKTQTDLPSTIIRKPLFHYPLFMALLMLGIFSVMVHWKGGEDEYVAIQL